MGNSLKSSTSTGADIFIPAIKKMSKYRNMTEKLTPFHKTYKTLDQTLSQQKQRLWEV